LNMEEYKNSIQPGNYRLKVNDNDGNEIYSKTYTFHNTDITITDCEQKWWKRDPWIGGYSLFGLRLTVQNSGDTIFYPHALDATFDSTAYSKFVLPSSILPHTSDYVDCFIYLESPPIDGTFSLSLKDISDNIVATNSFSVNIVDNVPVKQFTWSHNGRKRVNIPKPEFLYDYYVGLNRTAHEDYALYVFDIYDEEYLDIILESLLFGFSSTSSDVEKINYLASFVQHLDYVQETGNTFDYPLYPIETIFDNGGDCEDLAILTANILHRAGYNIALLRLTDHMAVGVKLSQEAVQGYEFYVDDYYFLETTSENSECGIIPTNYADSSSSVILHTIENRPLISHVWENDYLIIYENTDRGNLVKVSCIVENLGIETADSIIVEGGFFLLGGTKIKGESTTIYSLDAGSKTEVKITVDTPSTKNIWFKTRIYYDNYMVDDRESADAFNKA